MTSKYTPAKINAKEVEAYRQQCGAGMIEAQVYFKKRNMLASLKVLRAEASTVQKVEWLLDRFEEGLMK